MYAKSICAALCALALAGCGGGGGGSAVIEEPTALNSPYVQNAERFDTLADASNLVTQSTPDQVPLAGVGQFEGVVAFAFLPESSLGDVVLGDLSLDVDFAQNSVTGSMDNFYGRDQTRRASDIAVTEGIVARGTTGAGVFVPFSGTLAFAGNTAEIAGLMSAGFGGVDAPFMRGEFDASYRVTPPSGPSATGATAVPLDAYMIARQR